MRIFVIQLVHGGNNSLLVQATLEWQCEFPQANNISLSDSWILANDANNDSITTALNE